MDQNQDEIPDQLLFYGRLKREIHYHFVNHIKPPSVMHIFHAIDPDVLNQVDMTRIRACQSKDGDMEAASLLLELLVVYKDWFSCLIKVLRHRDVKLSHVADTFEKQYEKVYKELFPNCPYACANRDFQRQASNKGSQYEKSKQDPEWMQSQESPLDGVMSTFTLRDLSSKSTDFVSDSPMTEDSPEPASSEEPEKEQEKSSEPEIDLPKRALLKQRHGPEYDFSYEETSTALKSLPGWLEETEERKIEETLRSLCSEDGHYILWFWERKKRPGVCVTFRNRIKTFIVHKRPAKQKGEKIQFFIDRKGTSFPDLRRLLDHHLENGVRDMSSKGETIAFQHPVKELN